MHRIALFSDTHGSTFTMRSSLSEISAENLTVIHLGDGAEEAERLMMYHPEAAYLAVRGNCDGGVSLPLSRTVDIDGVRIMLAHGHEFGVKSSLSHAARAAAKAGAALFLYGHTHIAADDTVEFDGKSVRMINPGAAALGKWAEIVICDGEVSVRLHP